MHGEVGVGRLAVFKVARIIRMAPASLHQSEHRVVISKGTVVRHALRYTCMSLYRCKCEPDMDVSMSGSQN